MPVRRSHKCESSNEFASQWRRRGYRTQSVNVSSQPALAKHITYTALAITPINKEPMLEIMFSRMSKIYCRLEDRQKRTHVGSRVGGIAAAAGVVMYAGAETSSMLRGRSSGWEVPVQLRPA